MIVLTMGRPRASNVPDGGWPGGEGGRGPWAQVGNRNQNHHVQQSMSQPQWRFPAQDAKGGKFPSPGNKCFKATGPVNGSRSGPFDVLTTAAKNKDQPIRDGGYRTGRRKIAAMRRKMDGLEKKEWQTDMRFQRGGWEKVLC